MMLLLFTISLLILASFIESFQLYKNKNTILEKALKLNSNHIENDCKTLGIDFGTSGVRITIISYSYKSNDIAVDLSENILYENSLKQSISIWIDSLNLLLSNIYAKNPTIFSQINCISLCGTSASCFLYDTSNELNHRSVRMYDYNVLKGESTESGMKAMKVIKDFAPSGSAANSPTSTLAKLLSWHFEKSISLNERLIHQADYILAYLLYGYNISNNQIFSDWHNALKLGFDVSSLSYPTWFLKLFKEFDINEQILPKVVEPGRIIGNISPYFVDKYGFNKNCKISAGTTDSIAAFLATGAKNPGQAVTSLGSTVAIKLISTVKVEDSLRGIYSHRLMNDRNNSTCLWLVGGASNVGCAILRKENFSNDEIELLSKDINPSIDIDLEYYPLCNVGERFPINDPNKIPILDPKPNSRKEYLHGILQGITQVEVSGYQALRELGATTLTEVLTCGGGAKNDNWTKMRERFLKVPTKKANNVEASYGCALLAKRGLDH